MSTNLHPALVDDLYILSANEEAMEEAIERFKGSSTGEALKAIFGAQKSLRAKLVAMPDPAGVAAG